MEIQTLMNIGSNGILAIILLAFLSRKLILGIELEESNKLAHETLKRTEEMWRKDIVELQSRNKKCRNCNRLNERNANYCRQCGNDFTTLNK
jgi:ribosomal protein L40E